MSTYISSKCLPKVQGRPFRHEDCVTGPDPRWPFEPQPCECPCHQSKARQAALARRLPRWLRRLIWS